MATALAVQRLVLKGDGINCCAKPIECFDVLDKIAGVSVVILRVKVVPISCSSQFLYVVSASDLEM